MSQYKAIIFDLDGTAVPNRMDTAPSSRVIETVSRYQYQIHLAAATGRPRRIALPILSALNIIEPCAIAAGTQVFNPHTGKLLKEDLLTAADVAQILQICHHSTAEILIGEEILGEGRPASNRQPSATNVMYLMHMNPADMAHIIPKLSSIPTIAVTSLISWTGEGVDVHITPRTATKEHAISEILSMMGVTKDETIGIGDADNDLHLFKAVGLKIAMGNATSALKAAADLIAPSVDDDGLAIIIERYANPQ